jgi:CO/xanthine dehydrogenase FAD-binding subunit
MGVAIPTTIDETLGLLADDAEAELLAGGTDFMVEVNFARRRPRSVVALARVDELRGWTRRDGTAVLRAGLTYREMQAPAFAATVPGLAQAARTVGSPQIRNAGTLGGNLATASPAGDTLPVLAALDARIAIRSAAGAREIGFDDLHIGPKQHTLELGEMITEVSVPAAPGRQEFLKVGTRNAMVIAVCNVALVVQPAERRVRCAIGAAGPTVIRARDAEAWVEDRIDWDDGGADAAMIEEFGRRVGDAARPIDDHRSSAAYRRHAVGVLASRALRRATVGEAERVNP